MSEQAVQFLRTLNSIIYSVSLSEALSILDAALLINPAKFDWNAATLDQRADEARKHESVMAFLPDRKIMAIKEIRTISGLGLKESKDIIDTIQPPAQIRTLTQPCCGYSSSFLHYGWCHNNTDEPPF